MSLEVGKLVPDLIFRHYEKWKEDLMPILLQLGQIITKEEMEHKWEDIDPVDPNEWDGTTLWDAFRKWLL